MKTLPVAIQVYSVRDEASSNFEQTMLELKKLGYDGVELAGLYGHTPEEIRDILIKTGLTPISAHVPYLEFEKDLRGTITSYITIGCRYLVIPYLTEDYRYGTEKFKEVMKFIPVIAQACEQAGVMLLYHNHAFEFEKTEAGEYVLDYMYRMIPENELKMELDTCWANVAGVSPVQYLRKYSGRSPVVHLKDYNDSEPFEFKAVGYGVQDMPSILAEAVAVGCGWVIVEQDLHRENTAMEDAYLSRQYLKSLGW
jgi:sugar phosphate isomerase/epimerase